MGKPAHIASFDQQHMVDAYTTMVFSEEELSAAERILDRVSRLQSPAREREFVRLVLSAQRSGKKRR